MLTKDYISIGKILSTFGLKGGLKIAHSGGILSQANLESVTIFLNPTTPINVKIQKQENKPTYSILWFENHTSISDVEKYLGLKLYLHKNDFPQKQEGEFFIFELLGLIPKYQGNLQTEFHLQKVIENPAHPILSFSNGSQEILIPFINRFVGEVNIQETWIEIFDWEDWLDASL